MSTLKTDNGCIKAIANGNSYMEDRHSITKAKNLEIFGVFDGHNGSYISQFLSKNLGKILIENLSKNKKNGTKTIIRNTFLDIDRKLMTKYLKKKESPGSTTVLAIVRPKDIIVVNLGDSRCVILDSNDKLIFASRDHKPDYKTERERIKKAGGIVKKYPGETIYRVTAPWASNAMGTSRGFGDFDLKRDKHGCYQGELAVVSPTPSIHIIPRETGQKYKLFLASDGVWDVVDNKLLQKISKTSHLKKTCSSIVNLSKKSEDNITILAVTI